MEQPIILFLWPLLNIEQILGCTFMGYLAYHQLGAPPACLLNHPYIMSAYFWTFLDPPNHNVSICTVLNVSKNCHFFNLPTRLFCWRNKWMVPILNCPSSNTYRHFTNIPWMNEKKESQFFRPNIHKFFVTLKKKSICRMQIMVITHEPSTTDQKWI
jgi:hypothetical protein